MPPPKRVPRPKSDVQFMMVSEDRLRKAITVRLARGSWKQAEHDSGIQMKRLMYWHTHPHSKPGARWHTLYALMARERENTIAEKLAPPKEVTTEGFQSPEQLCDHWSPEAARIQIETMLDPDANRRDRLEAASKVLALGGHSPVTKSVVVSAPLNDPKVAALVVGALKEIGEAYRPALLAEFTGGDVDEEPAIEVEAQAPEEVTALSSGVSGET